MAKAGSDEARELTAMAQRAQLLDKGLPEAMRAGLLQQLEGKLGMRCGGCHRRITIGLQFTRLDIQIGPSGGPEADVLKLSACNREDCDYAEKAMQGATAMEMVEYQWLDGANIDAVLGREEPITHCPQCGCELAPKDPEGFPLAPEHKDGCTAVADAAEELVNTLDPEGKNSELRGWADGVQRVEEGGEYPEAKAS